MKFSLDYRLKVGDDAVALSSVVKNIEAHREKLKDVAGLEGELVIVHDGNEQTADYADPAMRLVGGWIRKLPWIIGGDTETVALRNSEQCYAFVRTGDGVEISFFNGSEAEVEEYVFEPITVHLDVFANESLQLAERLVRVVKALAPTLLDTDEDCRDLVASLDEAKNAWRDHQLHRR
jgi:hypothetical protein